MPHIPDHPQETPQRPPIGLSGKQQWEQFFENQHDAKNPPEAQPEESTEDPEAGEGGLIQSTGRGVARAANEVSDLAFGAARGAAGLALDTIKGTGLYKMFGDDEEEKEWLDWYEDKSAALDAPTENPFRFDIKGRAEGWWGAYESMVQFGVGFIPAARALKAAGMISGIARGATAGAVADFAVFDPHEERLSDMIEQGPDWMSNPLTGILASDEDDSEAVGRFKNTVEGLLLGGTIDGIIGMARIVRAKRGVQAGALSPEEGAREVDRAVDEMDAAQRERDRAAREADADDPVDLREPTQAVQEAAEQRRGVRRRLAEAVDPTLRDEQASAILDDLTGLRNKNALERATPRIDDDPLTEWAFIDLRDFKALNDNLGHEAGDDFLRSAGEALRGIGLDERSIFRAGGDEFAIAVPKGQGEEVGRLAIEAIGEMPVPDTPFTVRGRFGVGQTLDEADKAMLASKATETGPRNRNALADEVDSQVRGSGAPPPGSTPAVRMPDGTVLTHPEGHEKALIDAENRGQVSSQEIDEAVEDLEFGYQTDDGFTESTFPSQFLDKETVPERPRVLREEPFGIKEIEDGQFELKILDDRIDPRENPVRYGTRAEAERAAASYNTVSRLQGARPRYRAGRIELDGRDVALIRNVAERMRNGADVGESIRDGDALNLGRIESSEDVAEYINAISRVFDEQFDNATFRAEEGQGVPRAKTLKQAEGIIRGVSGAEMVEHLEGLEGITRVLPQTLTAVRLMLAGQGERVVKIARAVDLDPGNTVAVRGLLSEMDLMANLTVHLGGISSDVGRALNALGIDLDKETIERALKTQGTEATEESVSRGARIMTDMAKEKNMSPREVAAMARSLVMTKGDHASVLRALRLTAESARRHQKDATFGDKLVAFRASMMLSGPVTHATNLMSSLAASMQIPVEYMIGGVSRGETKLVRQGWDILTAPAANGFWAVRQAFSGAVRSLKENRSILDPRFVKDERGFSQILNQSEAGFWANVLGAPGRALIAGDEFVKRLSYLSHVRAQSLRMARKDNLEMGLNMTTKEMQERVALDIEASFDNNDAALWANSLEHARNSTFTSKPQPGTLGHGLQEMANNHLGVRLLLPFVSTPVNILEFSVQRFPGAHKFNREMKEMWAAGGEQRAIAQGRMLMGSLMYSVGAMLAHNGLVTGKGPANPQLRTQMLEAGWQPHSVRVGDKWISYRRLEPIATPIGIMADGVEMMGEADAQTAEEMAVAMSAATAASVSSKTFLLGLTEFFEAVGSGEEYKMQNFIESFATSFTNPALLRQAKSGMGDPIWREADGIFESIRQGLPGLSETLEPRRNIFGEPVMRTSRATYGPIGNALNNSLNPLTVVHNEGIDDIQLELAELGKAMSMPRDRLAGGRIRLRDGERWQNKNPERRGQSPYDRWMELVSETNLRERVAKIVRSSQWERMGAGTETYPGGQRHELVNGIIQRHQEIARQRMLLEYPDLHEALQNERTSEVEALFSN